jgi:hypothetical protein
MTGCSPIRSEVICDQLVGDKAIFLQQLAHQFERRPLVPPGLDYLKQAISKYFAG